MQTNDSQIQNNVNAEQNTAVEYPRDTAAARGLANCHVCGLVTPVEHERCPRCNSKLHLRSPYSIQRTLALVITAMLFYIPANTLPIMTTTLLGKDDPSTILSGVITFFEHGSYFVAFVIFAASVMIPLAKMMIILWLCYTVTKREKVGKHELSRLYRITEFIGKWSMIDVFVVAILVALVQVSGLMTIEPGAAAQAFAGVVVLTMLAAQQFDIRLIWDKQK